MFNRFFIEISKEYRAGDKNTYRLQGLDQKPFLVGNVSLEGSLQEALNIVVNLDADLH